MLFYREDDQSFSESFSRLSRSLSNRVFVIMSIIASKSKVIFL